MLLTVKKIENAKSKDKPYKLSDGNGLYLYISSASTRSTLNPNSAKRDPTKSWRYDYRFGDKRYTLTFGTYPIIGLAEARDLLLSTKKQLASGTNPALEKRIRKLTLLTTLADTFVASAEAWFAAKKDLRSYAWRANNGLHLRRDLLPKIGCMPITSVDRHLLLAILESVKRAHGVKVAERARQTAAQVFDYAIRKAKTDSNPAQMLRNWEDIPPKTSHAPLRDNQILDFLERVDAYPGFMTTKLCMKLLLLTFVRKNELVKAKWDEFDLINGMWAIPAERMKMKEAHAVPLSKQALCTLHQLKPICCGSEFLFPSISSIEHPMSGSTLNIAFKRMGYGGQFSPHGIRATASTWLNENGFRQDVIERQLAHAERNQIRAAYNRADYMKERTELMQVWADFIEPKGD